MTWRGHGFNFQPHLICRQTLAISPRIAPEFCSRFPPSENRGRRECRAPDAPDSRVCKIVVERTRVSQVTPDSPSIPRAMVLTASFALSPATGLSCHRHPGGIAPQDLTPASGCQDHTPSPSAQAPFVKGAACVHRIPSNVRDDRETPLRVGRDGMAISLFLPSRQAKFLKFRNRYSLTLRVQ